jgi:hypothetical protein
LEDTDHPDIAKLLIDNNDPDFFKKIGGKQVFKYLYIGGSYSRVPALGPGESSCIAMIATALFLTAVLQ